MYNNNSLRRYALSIAVVFFFTGCSMLTTAVTKTPSPIYTPTSPNPTVITQSVAPTHFGGSSTIVFTSNRDGNFEIYSMDSDGSNQSRLTNSPTDDWFPKSSPRGDLILFWSYQEGPPVVARLSWILPDGSQQGILADHVSAYTAWSPDGKYVVYTAGGKGNADLYGTYAGGGTPGQLTTDPEDDIEPAWSPDGTTIAFVSYRDGGVLPRIYLMDANGRNQRRLTQSNMMEMEPDWSPDGSTIAFISGDDISTNIFLVDADGTNIRQFTSETNSHNENPVWSPDGTMIACWSDRNGNREIYVINVDESWLINLTNHPADDENPSWLK